MIFQLLINPTIILSFLLVLVVLLGIALAGAFSPKLLPEPFTDVLSALIDVGV